MPIADYVKETWEALVEGNAYGEFPVGEAKLAYGW